LEKITPPNIFVPFFSEIMQILVEEPNRYLHQYFDMIDEQHTPLSDMPMYEMHLFLSVILQVGHD
jgi:hypothetical protein